MGKTHMLYRIIFILLYTKITKTQTLFKMSVTSILATIAQLPYSFTFPIFQHYNSWNKPNFQE